MHLLFITFFRSFNIFFFSNRYVISKKLFVSTPSILSFIFVVTIKARTIPIINIHAARNVKLLFPVKYAANDVAENIAINIAREIKRFTILFPLPHFHAAMRLVDDGGRLPRGRGLGQWAGRGEVKEGKKEGGSEEPPLVDKRACQRR